MERIEAKSPPGIPDVFAVEKERSVATWVELKNVKGRFLVGDLSLSPEQAIKLEEFSKVMRVFLLVFYAERYYLFTGVGNFYRIRKGIDEKWMEENAAEISPDINDIKTKLKKLL